MYLGREEVKSRPYAEATQRVIDEEVATLLREAEQRATVTLTNHRQALDRLTELLLEREPSTAPPWRRSSTASRLGASRPGQRQARDPLSTRQPSPFTAVPMWPVVDATCGARLC